MANSVPRFHCAHLPHPRLAQTPCVLDADESHHARKVLRLKPGTAIELFDGQGGLAQAKLAAYEGRSAVCQVVSLERHDPPRPRVTVAAAIPKGGRAEPMVNQLSQAGADVFVPMVSEHSVVDPREGKLERFGRHAIESAKQCGRLHVMAVEPTRGFDALLAESADVRLLAAPGGGSAAGLGERVARAGRVLVLIGPEGGFSEAEQAAAAEAGFQQWAIGPYTMRIETAAVAAAALLRYLATSTRSSQGE
ncbi:MAG: RsmE family RNA methyltransferase [Phycisphaeraceae bacterium]